MEMRYWVLRSPAEIAVCPSPFSPIITSTTAQPFLTPHHPPNPTPDVDRETVSPEGKDIVGRLLTVDAAKRLSAHEALNHPWVAGQVFEGDEGKGRQQLQSTTDKLKTMAVKRESMRQQSFKQAADGAAAAATVAAAVGGPATLHEGEDEGL